MRVSSHPQCIRELGAPTPESKEAVSTAEEAAPTEESCRKSAGSFRGDEWNIALLVFLYLLQGIPLGLTSALPLILQKRNIDFADQAQFSFCLWPFCLKLLWAPVVDAVYSTRFGKRKLWLVPSQTLLGLLMILISMKLDCWLGDGTLDHPPDLPFLTFVFFVLNFLTATQDIAVDGWAITMLQRRNVGYASTCACIGQTIGLFFGYNIFLTLTSAEFCNAYLFFLQPKPMPTGIISFFAFIFFWAIVILVTTFMVGIFKKDNSLELFKANEAHNLSMRRSYQLLWKILRLRPIQLMATIFLTVEIAFATTDNVFPLKLMENGLQQDKIALIDVPLIPMKIILPMVISKYTTGPCPMSTCFVKIIPYKLIVGLLLAALVYATPFFKNGREFSIFYYGLLLLLLGLHQMMSYCMSVAAMAFIARVSDPRCGAIYMALLATVINLGSTWPSTVVLWLVDELTFRKCTKFNQNNSIPVQTTEICSTYVDGYYIEAIVCIFIGIGWLHFGKRMVERLQKLNNSAWLVDSMFNFNTDVEKQAPVE